ncbi:MAG: hypothetical protein J2P36_28275, partial [Ktedonobacteraceae bacterium]|nr:hypothetical protein [Ktedonobacteraceae bacterium]
NRAAQEVERAFYDYSPAWAGNETRLVNLGEVRLLLQASSAQALNLSFDVRQGERRLDEVIAQVEAFPQACLWVIGPSSQPTDLEARLRRREFKRVREWEGLVLDDLSQTIPRNSEVVIEPLTQDNMEEYAHAIAGDRTSPLYAQALAQAQRFVRLVPQQVQIDLARLDGVVAGYAVLRIEPRQIAYFRSAMTVPAFRQRGVYLSLVAHRLAQARTVGCNVAVIQAVAETSAPILKKRGFRPVCRFIGLARSAEP